MSNPAGWSSGWIDVKSGAQAELEHAYTGSQIEIAGPGGAIGSMAKPTPTIAITAEMWERLCGPQPRIGSRTHF
jgi:hypothetical protein